MVGWATKTGRRRIHKERPQPSNRRGKGLLEKHKDYVKRARDFHAKQDRLAKLKLKAALRNPDEFHFGMIHSQVDQQTGTTVSTKGRGSHSAQVLKDYNTQDLGYLYTQRSMIMKVR